MSIVYIHRRKDIKNPFLNVFYVGIGKNIKRAKSKEKRNIYWHNIVNKFGYDIEITHQDIFWEEACSIEKYLINFYGRHDLNLGNLANMTDGGEGSLNISMELRERKSLLMSGENHYCFGVKGINHPLFGIKRSEEVLLKMKESRSKRPHPMLGRKHTIATMIKMSNSAKGRRLSEETRKKISEANKGKTLSEKSRKKISEANKGRRLSEETRKKISEANKGDKHPMYGKLGTMLGKKMSQNSKNKISDKLTKKFSKHEYETMFNLYKNKISLREIGRKFNTTHGKISKIIKKYINEENKTALLNASLQYRRYAPICS